MAKHKSGYDILKEKYQELQNRYNEIDHFYEKLIKDWERSFNKQHEEHKLELEKLENKRLFMIHQMEEAKNTMNELYAHMGAFRRWTWNRKHKS